MSQDIVLQEEFGRDLGLVHEVVITGRKLGAGKEFWAKLAHDGDLLMTAMDAVEDAINLAAPRQTFNVTVDYALTREGMMLAARCHHGEVFKQYDFPTDSSGQAKVAIEVFLFIKERLGDEILAKLDELGYRPATLAEALALFTAHGDAVWDLCMKYREKEILIAGTEINGHFPTANLATSDHKRWKDTYFSLRDEHRINMCMKRFLTLAVRKS